MTLVRRHSRAVAQGLALAGLAVVEVFALLAQLAAFVPGFGLGLVFLLPPPIVHSRRVANLARRLADEWSGVDIPRPYGPAPPPPVPGPDGRYVRDRQLYRTPLVPATLNRVDWVLGDAATWRDLRWLLLDPMIGGLLAVGPAALAAGGVGFAATALVGVGFAATPATAYWWAVPAGLLVALAGFAVAPAAVWLHARWTRLMLRPKVVRPAAARRKLWLGRRFVVFMQLLALLALTAAGVPVAVMSLLAVVLTFGLGIVVVFPPAVEHLRWLADLRRRLAREWSGVAVDRPYLPRPALPPLRPDGLYAVGRHLFKTTRWAAYNQRSTWLMRDRATWRDILWQVTDPVVGGLLLLVPLAAVGYGTWGLVLPRLVMDLGLRTGGGDWYGAIAGSAVAAIPVGVALIAFGVLIAPAALCLHGRWTRLLLAPSERSRLALRVQQLTETRADATESAASELRRIERDLHDGAQARLVTMGITLGAIEHLLDKDPAAARALLAETRASSAKALADLRDLVRGIHPPVLAERGLGDAVRALALDSPIPTDVAVDLPGRPDPAVETAAYFAVSELLANVAKHARARHTTVDIRYVDGRLRATVRDDGRGGADPAHGSGLRGVQRRLGTFDGVLTVDSPPGGPTTVNLEVPCALSSRKTSTC